MSSPPPYGLRNVGPMAYTIYMNVRSTYKGQTYKEVTIEHDFDDRPVSDDLLVGFAMAKVGETPGSLYGWSVSRPSQYPHMAVVTLTTD